jgi:hypothetical protein
LNHDSVLLEAPTNEENDMAKTTKCGCCGAAKPTTHKSWGGEELAVCATCAKLGKTKALARRAKAQKVETAKDEAGARGDRAAVQAAEKPASKPAANAEKPARVTVASAVRALVAEGKTNEEIWQVIQPQFALGDDKRWYASWYRWDMARRAAKESA